MEEIYKSCFESYEVSNCGGIRRKLLTGEYRTINCSLNNRGYKYFQLSRGGKRNNFLVHHLVAEHFIGERPENMVVDHIDRNKINNCVKNLRYVTHSENLKNCDRYIQELTVEDGETRKKAYSRYYTDKNREQIKAKKKLDYQKHRESRLQKAKQYKEINRDTILAKHAEKVLCECGEWGTVGHLSRHRKTKKHLDYISSLENKQEQNLNL